MITNSLTKNRFENMTTPIDIAKPLLWKASFWIGRIQVFQITLPDIIHADKGTIYPKLAPVANA